MAIDNLKKVYWQFENFVANLELQPESEIEALCHKLKSNNEFYHVCHRAKQEIDELSVNKSKEVIKSYYNLFSEVNSLLNNWRENKLEEKSKINEIKYSLKPIWSVERKLENYYSDFYLHGVNPKDLEVLEGTKQSRFDNSKTPSENIFVASKTKRRFSDYDLKSITTYTKDEAKHKYDLLNGSVYHEKTGELLREEKPDNTSFILQLVGMYVLDVKKFLNYQYSNSNNKTDLFTFIKYAVLHSKRIKHEGTKQQIKDWVQEIENSKQHTQESTDQPHREEKPKYFAKHYVLAFLFDCDANNESYPIGNKKEVERIGNERMGYGKGNTFYKNFNDIINNPNFNIKNEASLIDLVGENWLNIVTELSKNPELVKKHIKESDIIK